jgi:serine/threonine-protein kinase
MDQSVPAGSKLSRGSSIAITVSRGPIGGEVVTPDLTGKTLSEAEKVLVRHGLSVGRLTYQSGFDLVPNTIIDQFPRPGDKIARGDSVHLFVVKLTDIKEKTRIPEN